MSWHSITNIVVKRTVFKNIITFIFLIGGFYTLVSLGFWQLDRLTWKNDILEKIETQENIDPMSVELDLSDDTEFQRGYIEGRFMNEPSIHIVPRTFQGKVGYHVLSPFKIKSGQVILVNHGWVEDGSGEDTLLTPRKIAGYLQTPDMPNSFTPNNNAEQKLWYWVDIDMLEGMYNASLYNKVVYLESPSSTNPQTFEDLPKPRNKHKQYMMFWFGMSALWLLMSLLVYFKRVKNS